MEKKGWIRSKGFEDACPFGLPISKACKNSGKSTLRMCPLDYAKEEEDKKEEIKNANRRVYIYHKTGKRCPFAINVMGKNVVNCDWGDVGQGVGGAELTGSPLYPQTFAGVGLEGLYGFPLGFYADNNQSRNMPYGLFSLLGSSKPEIEKYAKYIEEDPKFEDIRKRMKNSKLTEDDLNFIIREIKNV